MRKNDDILSEEAEVITFHHRGVGLRRLRFPRPRARRDDPVRSQPELRPGSAVDGDRDGQPVAGDPVNSSNVAEYSPGCFAF
ncbi:hypothetical protein BV898_03669 [Hypsibius exemplaris]|uniref:Uncharacterized protein n=1 Tax=Hypsibius exemplaris TaxID=2072580 RepID=A0A1W0X4S0_HYPEX|nr:hypothetical protein BV898_03669 [Hypsibius exemplaris]